MLDIQYIRDNKDLVKEKSQQKGCDVDLAHLLSLDTKRKSLIQEIEAGRAKINLQTKSFEGKVPSEDQRAAVRTIKEEINLDEKSLATVDVDYWKLLKAVPNMPADDVPVGAGEDDNKVIKTVGKPPKFDFKAKDHWQIGSQKGWIDMQRAAKVAGARFTYLKGDLVKLQFALWQFALDKLSDEKVLKEIIDKNKLKVSSKPFVPVLPPAMARTEIYESTGRLDKEEQTYKLEGDELWLNASAEHTLAPMYSNEILNEADLPIRYIGSTTAFRREAGTYGKDMEGILRLHQFDKLEMESFDLPEDSAQEHLLMIAIQEYLMQQLDLPYQVVLKCTAEIGGPNARGVDIEAWLPGQNRYRETHTADYITDYQARRMQTRVRRKDGTIQLVHNNDATAFSQRPLIAIIENNQTKDGDVVVPEVLRSYMGGRDKI